MEFSGMLIVLIETLWNVNKFEMFKRQTGWDVLIETLWNVNPH